VIYRYVDAPAHPHSGDKGRASLRQNRITRQWQVFTMPKVGNSWNEPGYGWGRWVPLSSLPSIARRT
jgi:hypothetical protein